MSQTICQSECRSDNSITLARVPCICGSDGPPFVPKQNRVGGPVISGLTGSRDVEVGGWPVTMTFNAAVVQDAAIPYTSPVSSVPGNGWRYRALVTPTPVLDAMQPWLTIEISSERRIGFDVQSIMQGDDLTFSFDTAPIEVQDSAILQGEIYHVTRTPALSGTPFIFAPGTIKMYVYPIRAEMRAMSVLLNAWNLFE